MIPLFLMMLTQTALGQTNLQETRTELLQGTWMIDTMYIDFDMSEEMFVLYQEKFETIKAETSFVFNADSTYTKNSNQAPRHGRWRISPNGNMIIIQFKDSDEISRTLIDQLDENHLVMIPVDQSAQNSRVELVKVQKDD